LITLPQALLQKSRKYLLKAEWNEKVAKHLEKCLATLGE
jgi:hypothetical protein